MYNPVSLQLLFKRFCIAITLTVLYIVNFFLEIVSSFIELQYVAQFNKSQSVGEIVSELKLAHQSFGPTETENYHIARIRFTLRHLTINHFLKRKTIT